MTRNWKILIATCQILVAILALIGSATVAIFIAALLDSTQFL